MAQAQEKSGFQPRGVHPGAGKDQGDKGPSPRGTTQEGAYRAIPGGVRASAGGEDGDRPRETKGPSKNRPPSLT